MNFSSNICYFILPVSPSDPIHDYTSFRIHLVKDIHNDYEFLLYYKKSLYTEIPAYMHGYNFFFGRFFHIRIANGINGLTLYRHSLS